MTPVRPPDLPSLPDTVPARMVNEFVYCPRLFHLEWVGCQFTTSDDVEEGLYVHRVVDTPAGDLPDPAEDMEHLAGRASRSFWLTSTDLGVSAKIDLVEIEDGGAVVPVDYKKGHPAPRRRIWPSDEIQSVLQAMLLREAGYQVDHAEVWYAETRQRLHLPIDESRVADARNTLAELWQTAARETPPPPLEDSPRCSGCSLVGICLPDEVNALRARERQPARPRRLMATNPDNGPVYVQEQGSVVGVSRGRLEISKERAKLGSYRLIDVSQVCLRGNITVTPQAMRELHAREIPVCWFTYGGWFSGLSSGLPAKNVDLRRAQYTVSPEVRVAAASHMIEGKIRNSRTLLRRNNRHDCGTSLDQLRDLANSAGQATSPPTLLGIEGTAARIYFSHFTGMISENTPLDIDAFNHNGRARRPPPDPINTLLSFTYSLLVKDITATLNAVGFDPYYGVFHQPRYGRPALALDLAEEFRPLVGDSTVIQLVNNGEIRPNHISRIAGGCQLDADGRRAILTAYERRMNHEIKHPVFGYKVTYRRAIEVQTRILAAYLTGELPEYTPFTTR